MNNANENLALHLLDRLDVAADENDRVDQIAGLVRGLASDRRAQAAEITRLSAALSEALAQLEAERARLDCMIGAQVWVQWTTRDGSIRQCQAWTQNEDEEYIVLSGADRFFNTPREAIDAARSAPPLAIIPGDAL